MPKPKPSDYPKEKRWRFIQRSITDKELLEFSAAIIRNHGKKIDDVLPDLLSFINIGKINLKDVWLDLWVNIMHQMGLGYTWKDGKYLYATELSDYLNKTHNIKAYYLFWGLKFQYPFSYPKQKHYIDNGVAIQPVVLILEYFVELYRRTGDIKQTYLDKDEIALFLMRSKNHNDIGNNVIKILNNRKSNFDYKQIENNSPGFDEAGDHFINRGRLFIQNIELLKFIDNKVVVKDRYNLKQIELYLKFRKQPIVFKANTQDIRNHYFYLSYIYLDPDPTYLYDILLARKKVIFSSKKVLSQQELVVEPGSIKGTFRTTNTRARDFQGPLRKDLLIVYDGKCALCGMDLHDFLRTSHIVPVAVDPNIAADRACCILLCVIHDIALEKGYIYFNDNYQMKVNKNKIHIIKHPILIKEIIDRNGQILIIPKRFKPKIEYFKRHRIIHDI